MSTDASIRPLKIRAQRAQATRSAIISVARRLFVEQGYASTGTEQIVGAAAVGTRGALYHHFADKEALFEAVFAAISADLSDHIARNVDESESDPLALLRARFAVFLDCIASRKDAQTILFDGPTALGWQRFRDLQARHGLTGIRTQLQIAMDAGIIATQPLRPLSQLLLAMVDEAALYVAVAKQRKRARSEAAAALGHLLDGLRLRGPGDGKASPPRAQSDTSTARTRRKGRTSSRGSTSAPSAGPPRGNPETPRSRAPGPVRPERRGDRAEG
jgi:AcrR family transcriptional regulator